MSVIGPSSATVSAHDVSQDGHSPEDGHDPGRPRKRKRIALACCTCRERKIKCDGIKPVCTPCAKRGVLAVDCVYTVLLDSAKRGSEQEFIASLQQKVRALEARVVASSCANDAPTSAVSAVQGGGRTGGQDDRARSSCHPSNQAWNSSLGVESDLTQEQARATETSLTSDSHGNGPVSAMGATTMHQDRREIRRGTEYYGASSLVSLIDGVAEETRFEPSQNGTQQAFAPQGHHVHVRNFEAIANPSMQTMLQPQYALPPRKLADELLALYFDNNHIFYPWTHSASFRKQYETLWDTSSAFPSDQASVDVGLGGNNCPFNIYVCALNAMFALGCQFSDYPPSDKDSASATFCERINGLLHFDLLDSGSIACVQALLLFGMYLQCTNSPERCWNIIGLAYRMAVGLGLQSSIAPNDATPLEMAMRWRVWHACVQMDTTVCMTLGRPPTFTAVEDIPVPSAVDLAQFSPAGDSLDSDPLICNFFVQNSRAARMLGKILHRVYHPSLSTVSKASARSTQLPAAADALSAILGLHSELNDLASSSLSALELCVDQGSRANMVVERQRNVLNSRFLHMRVLLHRPCFTSFCSLARSGDHQTSTGEDDSFPVDDLPACMVQQSAFICVRTACELALSLQKATQEQATGAWWYSLFYIITCAVIVILTECTPRLVRRLAVGELDAAWSACLEVLENMGSGHSLPGQYIHSLKVLRSRGRMRSGEVYPPGEEAPRPADFRNTIDPLLHSQNVDQNLQVAHSMSQQDMLQYADYQNDDGNFFLPAFFGEWGADINSIIM